MDTEKLREPFPVEHIEWKPSATTRDKAKALAVPYADIRAYEDRLNETCDGWSTNIHWLKLENKIVCTVALVIEETSRENAGESPLNDENAATIAYAQAFKRACSSFGLGRYLYDLPTSWVPYDGDRKQITDEALTMLRRQYERLVAGDESQKKPSSKAEQPSKKEIPSNVTDLYQMAQDQLGLHIKHAVNVIQNYLDEQHGGGDIGAFIKTSPNNVAVLWNVLVEHEEAKGAELSEPEEIPF